MKPATNGKCLTATVKLRRDNLVLVSGLLGTIVGWFSIGATIPPTGGVMCTIFGITTPSSGYLFEHRAISCRKVYGKRAISASSYRIQRNWMGG